MPRKLTHSEFYKLIADKTNIAPERAKFLWQDIVDVIVNEVLLYGTISIPYLGTIKSFIRGGKVMRVPAGSTPETRGKVKEMYVEPYNQYSFKFVESFTDAVNGRGITMSQKRRQREAFRKLQREEESREKQFAYMEKAQSAMKEMQARRKKRQEDQKKFNKKGKEKRENALPKNKSYWDELEEESEE